jgi:hypothetical protein
LSSPFAFPSLKNGCVNETLTEMVFFNYQSFLSSFFTLVKKIDQTIFIYCMDSSQDSKKMTSHPSLKTTRNGQDVLQKLYIIGKWLCAWKAAANGRWVAVGMLGWASTIYFFIEKIRKDQILPLFSLFERVLYSWCMIRKR